jgi:hypothetical protein
VVILLPVGSVQCSCTRKKSCSRTGTIRNENIRTEVGIFPLKKQLKKTDRNERKIFIELMKLAFLNKPRLTKYKAKETLGDKRKR